MEYQVLQTDETTRSIVVVVVVVVVVVIAVVDEMDNFLVQQGSRANA
jgi:hypothetical protein